MPKTIMEDDETVLERIPSFFAKLSIILLRIADHGDR